MLSPEDSIVDYVISWKKNIVDFALSPEESIVNHISWR